MNWQEWLSRTFRRPKTRGAPTPVNPPRRFYLERLEDRDVPSTLDVVGVEILPTNLPNATNFQFRQIEAWSVNGSHGAPYVVGSPVGDSSRAALFYSAETTAGLSWSGPVWAPDVGVNPAAHNVSIADLLRSADGSPILIGSSMLTTDVAGTSWRLTSGGSTLTATLHTNPFGDSVATDLLGGDGVNFAGALSSSAGFNTGTFLNVLPSGQSSASSLALDRFGNMIVGGVNGSGRYWSMGASGQFEVNTPQLPAWSDGVNYYITEVHSHLMGGNVFHPTFEDTVPVLWNYDGTLAAMFTDPKFAGYGVTEIIDDQGVNVVLLNDSNFLGPSYIWAEGWAEPELALDYFPALAAGQSATVFDISSGGSLYLGIRIKDGSSTWDQYAALETKVTPDTPPDTTPPAVLSITRLDVTPTSSPTARFEVKFTEAVTGVDPSDFATWVTGSAVATVSSVTGSGDLYTVIVNLPSGAGTVGLKVLDDDTILDLFGNKLGGAGLGNGEFVGTDTYTIDRVAPGVSQTVINSGEIQRSMVKTVTFVFTEVVNLPANVKSAFRLTRSGLTVPVDLHASVSNAGGKTTVTLTFTGQQVIGGSLPDGSYKIELVPNTVRDSLGNFVSGAPSVTFHRVFGDLSGDGRVDRSELLTAARANGSKVGQARYIAALDFNGDGKLKGDDYIHVVERYLLSRWTVGPIWEPIIWAPGHRWYWNSWLGIWIRG